MARLPKRTNRMQRSERIDMTLGVGMIVCALAFLVGYLYLATINDCKYHRNTPRVIAYCQAWGL